MLTHFPEVLERKVVYLYALQQTLPLQVKPLVTRAPAHAPTHRDTLIKCILIMRLMGTANRLRTPTVLRLRSLPEFRQRGLGRDFPGIGRVMNYPVCKLTVTCEPKLLMSATSFPRISIESFSRMSRYHRQGLRPYLTQSLGEPGFS